MPTAFPPRFAPDERVYTGGRFVLSDYGALGDGSYEHDGGFFFATGTLGLALTAGAMAGRAIGNNARRNQAAQDAQGRWKVIDQGQIFVGTHGFYLVPDTGGLLSWGYGHLTSAQMAGLGTLWMTGSSDRGPITWIIQSGWAELIFTLWARLVHPQHQQYATGAWVPPGWADRIRAMRVAMPTRLSDESRLRQILG